MFFTIKSDNFEKKKTEKKDENRKKKDILSSQKSNLLNFGFKKENKSKESYISDENHEEKEVFIVKMLKNVIF